MRRLDLILFVLLVACGIAVVNSQHRARRLFVDLQRENSVGDELAADLRRLQASQATLAAANRVERAATSLHMHQPDPSRTVAITSAPVVASADERENAAPAAAATVQLAHAAVPGGRR